MSGLEREDHERKVPAIWGTTVCLGYHLLYEAFRIGPAAMTTDDRCGEKLGEVQCQLRVGHHPEAHVAGRRDTAGRRSWLLGRDYATNVTDSELQWADGFPRPSEPGL